MSIADQAFQEALAIKGLFDSQGWKMFEEKIQSLLDFEISYIEKKTKNCVNSEGLHDLNFHLAKKQVLKEILLMKEALADEFSSSEEEDANNTSQSVQS